MDAALETRQRSSKSSARRAQTDLNRESVTCFVPRSGGYLFKTAGRGAAAHLSTHRVTRDSEPTKQIGDRLSFIASIDPSPA